MCFQIANIWKWLGYIYCSTQDLKSILVLDAASSIQEATHSDGRKAMPQNWKNSHPQVKNFVLHNDFVSFSVQATGGSLHVRKESTQDYACECPWLHVKKYRLDKYKHVNVLPVCIQNFCFDKQQRNYCRSKKKEILRWIRCPCTHKHTHVWNKCKNE